MPRDVTLKTRFAPVSPGMTNFARNTRLAGSECVQNVYARTAVNPGNAANPALLA